MPYKLLFPYTFLNTENLDIKIIRTVMKRGILLSGKKYKLITIV